METTGSAGAPPVNRYAAPSAVVADVAPPIASDASPRFFPVSVTKLVVMSLATFGLYQVFWFYWNWKLLKAQGHDVRPVPRAIFGIFFCHSLFREVRDASESLGIGPRLASGTLATAWIVTQLMYRLPSPWWLLGFASVACFAPVQARINRINEAAAPGHDPNSRFGAWNWVGILIGGAWLLLTLLGALVQMRGR